MTSKRFQDLKSDVPRIESNVVGVPNPKIDMPDIHAIGEQDAKVIVRHEVACRVTWYDFIQSQGDFTKRENSRWWEKLSANTNFAHTDHPFT